MIREKLHSYLGSDPGFRYRGVEPGRLENFSDAAFALAITMLLISQEPPNNFDEVKRFTYDLFPFAACIALIILIWYEHNIFFLRYGLRNGKMVVLNTLFIVIIIFYVYPLKFLTKLIILGPIAYLVGDEVLLKEVTGMIQGRDVGDLMIIYGTGATSVFLTLCLMYRYALSQADALVLTKLERFDTRMSIQANLLMAFVPFLSVMMAFAFSKSNWAGPIAGFTYLLYTPLMFLFHGRVNKTRKRLLAEFMGNEGTD